MYPIRADYYPGQFKYTVVQQYLRDLSSDLGEHARNG